LACGRSMCCGRSGLLTLLSHFQVDRPPFDFSGGAWYWKTLANRAGVPSKVGSDLRCAHPFPSTWRERSVCLCLVFGVFAVVAACLALAVWHKLGEHLRGFVAAIAILLLMTSA
jgi:hypothetical protein